MPPLSLLRRAALLYCLPLAAMASSIAVTNRTEACIAGAAQYHSVSPSVLLAIVRHESRGRAQTVLRNTNGSIDVGLTGINSVHFAELRKKGVAPEQLLDECVSVYVGAWTLSKKIFKYGNTWKAVGAYHSETAYFNQRYQALIYNELVDMGVLGLGKIIVPALPKR